MSIVALTSDTLVASPGAGQIEYNGQFYGTDSNASRAQMQRLVLATSQASTSGTSIDFTGLPAWVKRITVMFNGVSTSGTSLLMAQLGSGSATTSGYVGTFISSAGVTSGQFSSGFVFSGNNGAADFRNGTLIITNLSGNTWNEMGIVVNTAAAQLSSSAGVVTLSGTLDRVRITTVNGTDTFDAGSINILYEG